MTTSALSPLSKMKLRERRCDSHRSEDDDIPLVKRWTMKAIVVRDQAAGTAGMRLAERPEPQAAINDVVVQIHASGIHRG